MIFGKYINRYYLKNAPVLLLVLAALLTVDYIQLLIPRLYRLVINGVNSIPSTINPVVSTSNFENQIKVTLPANSTITLQLFTTIAGTAILVSGGAGASLTIIRLS